MIIMKGNLHSMRFILHRKLKQTPTGKEPMLHKHWNGDFLKNIKINVRLRYLLTWNVKISALYTKINTHLTVFLALILIIANL